ncbi:phage tail tube protein [Sphingobacterium corticis]|uniref:Phage tail tube protein n=1 Tax=Sphingobacterium corticis TaxID=1812823 RepID=A0ABW5NGH0_9SPHI
MALRFENGSKYLLFVKRPAATTWKVLACLISNGVDMSADEITASSKCSGNAKEALPGETSWTMTANGNAIDSDLKADEASYKELKAIWKAGETCAWKMAKVGSTDVDYGMGHISSLSKAANHNEAVTFDLTINGTGALEDKEPAA